jgi:hypothetical protein
MRKFSTDFALPLRHSPIGLILAIFRDIVRAYHQLLALFPIFYHRDWLLLKLEFQFLKENLAVI